MLWCCTSLSLASLSLMAPFHAFLRLFLLTTSFLSTAGNQLCATISSGAKLGLLSVTFSSPSHIDFFTSKDALLYRVEEAKLGATWLDVRGVISYNYETDLFSGVASVNLKVDPLRAYYHFELKRTFARDVGLLVSRETQYLLNWQSKAPWYMEKPYVKYSIVHDQRRRPQEVYGQMISKDTYDETQDFIMYQLWIDGDEEDMRITSAMESTPPGHLNTPHRHFYYLERTENASQLLLVHRHNRNRTVGKAEAQMFGTLPRGFLYSDRLYLFDDALRCVFIVSSFNRIDLSVTFKDEPGKNLLFHRTNVPYEFFFKCYDGPPPTVRSTEDDAGRCETTIHTKPAPVDEDEDGPGRSWFKLLLAIFGCIVVCALLVALLLATRRNVPRSSTTVTSTSVHKGAIPKFTWQKADLPNKLSGSLSGSSTTVSSNTSRKVKTLSTTKSLNSS